MAINKETVLEFYKGYDEDVRASKSRYNMTEFRSTERILKRYFSELEAAPRVIELGCATGHYAYSLAPDCESYTGVDLSPDNIAVFEKKLAEKPLSCKSGKPVVCMTGDATDLSEIPDASFDAVLCLGPMYHLPPEERAKVFAECRRIAVPGGLLAFSYINAIGVVAGASCFQSLRGVYPNAEANYCAFELGHDDLRPDLFFFTSPEEMEAAALNAGLEKLGNYGLDFFFAADQLNEIEDERLPSFLELLDRMTDSPSCVGLSNHGLLVCKK